MIRKEHLNCLKHLSVDHVCSEGHGLWIGRSHNSRFVSYAVTRVRNKPCCDMISAVCSASTYMFPLAANGFKSKQHGYGYNQI